MMAVVVIAFAFASGVDPRRLAVLAGVLYLPLVVALLIGLHWLRARRDETNRPSLFCVGVASELRAGASLRDALTTAATSVGLAPIPGPTPNAPMAEVAAHVAGQLPSIGQELELTVVVASRSGSDSAALFDEIGSLALAQSEIRREVRVATAPGRATALVLVGAPLVYLVGQLGGGGLTSLIASPEQRLVATLGLGLFLTGLVAAGFVLWRAAR